MKKSLMIIIGIILIVIIVAIAFLLNSEDLSNNNIFNSEENSGSVTDSNVNEYDFEIDLVYHSDEGRDIHYSAYIPDNIEELDKVNMFITLPGYEGLYFQGVGANLESEDFAFTARNINNNIIILAPQLDDWGEQSARDTIALTRYYQGTYNIDKTYIEGYSGGGETLSLVLDSNPELYDAALMVSSQWDGGYDRVANERVPLYFFIGRDDDYYGSDSFRETYQELYDRYQETGLSDDEIDEILVLDVRDRDYFDSHGVSSEHAGGGLVAHEKDVMNWLLTK